MPCSGPCFCTSHTGCGKSSGLCWSFHRQPIWGAEPRSGLKPTVAQRGFHGTREKGNMGYRIPDPQEEKEKARRALAATAKQLQPSELQNKPPRLAGRCFGEQRSAFALPQRVLLRGIPIANLETAAACPRHGDIAGGRRCGKFIFPEAAISPPDTCYVTHLLVCLQIHCFNKQRFFS